MLFKTRAIGNQPVLDTEYSPNKEEACQLLEKIKESRAIIRETPKKSVLVNIVIAFFILISVAGLLSFIEKSLVSRNIVKISDPPAEENLLVDVDKDDTEEGNLLSHAY